MYRITSPTIELPQKNNLITDKSYSPIRDEIYENNQNSQNLTQFKLRSTFKAANGFLSQQTLDDNP